MENGYHVELLMRWTPFVLFIAVGCQEYDVEKTASPQIPQSPLADDPEGNGDGDGGRGSLDEDEDRLPGEEDEPSDGDDDDDDDHGDDDDDDDHGDDDDDEQTPGDDEDPCRTIGYWQNHTSLWPVSELTLGSHTYGQSDALTVLTSSSEDASLHLGRQLIATELNLLVGGPTDIVDVVDDAHQWLAAHGTILPFGTSTSSSEGQEATELATLLDGYNNQHCP